MVLDYMIETLLKHCDNKSVGVIIKNADGSFAFLERKLFPVGIAPPAGHVDDHGSFEQAAIDEVNEELGLVITRGNLRTTAINKRRINNPCRRIGGDHHVWSIYEVDQYKGELRPSPYETKGAGWYSARQLQELADRTKAFKAGKVTQSEWEADPGFEEVWLDFLTELGYAK
jgi:8-oxo-dGTP pyrophosphatase MutT (NUDIX family)